MKTKEERKVEREIKALDLTAQLRTQAQNKFVKDMAKDEGVDYYTMLLKCTGQTDPVDYHYTLGYKMSNPVFMIAMNLQKKSNREKAIENFKKELCPEELKIFEEEVVTENMRTNFKKEYEKVNPPNTRRKKLRSGWD